MTSKRSADDSAQAIPAPGIAASQGSNAAGRDVINSVALHADTALPPEAYAPIPHDAAADGLSNIPRTQLFVGRARELDALDAAFARPGAVVLQALSGLGGVGKTSLADRWADTRATSLVRWRIPAHSPAALDAGLAGLARALQPGLTQLPVELQTERALQWLAAHHDWLLVLDNVDRPDHVRPLLDRTAGSGRVLVTTRRGTGWHQLTSTIRLGSFSPDESAELFSRIFMQDGAREAEGIAEVCEELGHLALAVEQAAAFCYESATSPAAYLEMLRQSPADMYERGAEGEDARTVARIWRLTLDRLADTPLAGQALRILAWYAPDGIPRSVLAGLAEPPAVAEAISRLVAYSMISSNSDGSLSIHRLVQALSRAPKTDDPHREPEHVALAMVQAALGLEAAFPDDPSAPESWPLCRALLSHVEALVRHCPAQYDTVVMVHLLDRAGRYQVLQGTAGRAIDYHRRALACCERELPQSHRAVLSARNNLGLAYQSVGDLARALSLLEQTLAACERHLGRDDPQTLVLRNNVARASELSGDLHRAIALYEENFAERTRILGADHPKLLGSQNNLAYAYQSTGDLARAIALHERTLAEQTRTLGQEHPDTVNSRNNLACAFLSAGEPDKATPLFERTLADRARILGADHPDTLASRNNLAQAYLATGRTDRAISLHQQCLADRTRVQGAVHPDTLTSRNNLAHAYLTAGDAAQAVPLFEQALADQSQVMGTDNPSTLTSLNNLAYAYGCAGDPDRATALLEQALATCERVLSPQHPLTAITRDNLTAARSTRYFQFILAFPRLPRGEAGS